MAPDMRQFLTNNYQRPAWLIWLNAPADSGVTVSDQCNLRQSLRVASARRARRQYHMTEQRDVWSDVIPRSFDGFRRLGKSDECLVWAISDMQRRLADFPSQVTSQEVIITELLMHMTGLEVELWEAKYRA